MNPQFENIERDGMDKLIKLAKTLCRLITTFAVIIRGKYGDNVAIMALLTAVENMCPLIADAEFEAIIYGGDNTIPSDTPESISGINEGLPPAEAPDFS